MAQTEVPKLETKQDKYTEYATAFYGDLPASQLHNFRNPLMSLVSILKSDLRVKFSNINEEKLHLAIVTGLSRLNELGAKHPNIHKSENGMYIEAFQHACIRVRSLNALKQAAADIREREKQEAEAMVKADDRNEVLAGLLNMYSELKEYCVKQEFENPEVEAYKLFLKSDLSEFDFGGYTCYVVAMKIPKQNNIYMNEEVVAAINAHPRLPNRRLPSEVHPAAMSFGSVGGYLK